MTSSTFSEIPPSLLFRYRLSCNKLSSNENGKGPVSLPTSCKLPELSGLNRDEMKPFAEVRTAWSPTGFYLTVKVTGKRQNVWCRSTQLLESDGLQIWIDTRDTHNVHRATRFCHWFLILPAGDGPLRTSPMATMLKINRAREHSPAVNRFPLQVESNLRKTGYTLSAFVPANAMNGWSPEEHCRVGFNYLVLDRELGEQTLGANSAYPIAEDPSLWSTLQLCP